MDNVHERWMKIDQGKEEICSEWCTHAWAMQAPDIGTLNRRSHSRNLPDGKGINKEKKGGVNGRKVEGRQ